jgi:hypothetical protein
MSGWNRLFVVIAVLWAMAAPFVLMADTNTPVEQAFMRCGDTAYRDYGASDSRIRLEKLREEDSKCLATFSRISLASKPLAAMIGIGDRTLGLVTWGFIVIPLALLWGISWALSRVVRWVAAGFLRRS